MLLGACQGAPRQAAVDRLDDSLVRDGETKADDPIVRQALADQIMVDPALVQQAGNHSARPTPLPPAMPIPVDDAAAPDPADPDARPALTLGERAARKAADAGRCRGELAYSAAWANRLPVEAPLYPDARVSEAAGFDTPACALRVVSFASAAAPGEVANYYAGAARRAGYVVRRAAGAGSLDVDADRARDGGAIRMSAAARRGGGSDVDLVVNGGR